jgi:hypothetical protein
VQSVPLRETGDQAHRRRRPEGWCRSDRSACDAITSYPAGEDATNDDRTATRSATGKESAMSTTTRRRGGLAGNPPDQPIPDPAAGAEPDPPPAAAGLTAPRKPVKFGGYIDPAISDRVRDAMVVLGPEWTLGEFMEQAFTMFLQAKADELNGGKPFPARRRDKLRPGRRIT